MRVGNGQSGWTSPATKSVHPHACGERSAAAISICAFAGSSPCVWGTEVVAGVSASATRFIPMRVGNGVILTRW